MSETSFSDRRGNTRKAQIHIRKRQKEKRDGRTKKSLHETQKTRDLCPVGLTAVIDGADLIFKTLHPLILQLHHEHENNQLDESSERTRDLRVCFESVAP